MQQSILKQYNALRSSLNQERARLQARLTRIEAALGGDLAAPLPAPAAKTLSPRRRRVRTARRRTSAAAVKTTGVQVTAKPEAKPVVADGAPVVRRPFSGGMVSPAETINRCKSCGRPAVAGDDYCYNCQ